MAGIADLDRNRLGCRRRAVRQGPGGACATCCGSPAARFQDDALIDPLPRPPAPGYAMQGRSGADYRNHHRLYSVCRDLEGVPDAWLECHVT